MPLVKMQLTERSICGCGYLLLDTPVGTEYKVDTDVKMQVRFICGGCKVEQSLEAVYVMVRGQSAGGFLPLKAFGPIEDEHTKR